ncbi:hypothetical protein MRB53_016092 [Persea americana]|uniref:Uncharacterized protein n=1 Tax=Persea americana TaxID=3435 RepID=A0ACC2M171_PERAE|nr:hypothetical protein MRB53_016092 [Persea americana]
MSGGISNMLVEDLHVWDAAVGLRVKTDRGRGGYITNSTIANMTMERVKIPIRFSSGSNDHPDEWWDPNALLVVRGIFIGFGGVLMFLVQVCIFLLKWNSSLGCFDLFVEYGGHDEDGLESRANAFVKKRPMVPATTLQDGVRRLFEEFVEHDFARTGSIASEKVELKEGPLEQFSH